MTVSSIQRGVYTRVDASNIESNQGTYFEAVMAPSFQIQMDMPQVGGTVTLETNKSFFSVVGISGFKIGNGGAGDSLVLNRLRGIVTAPICSFDVAVASSGEVLMPASDVDTTVTDFQPGDSFTLVGVAGAGVPTAEIHITVRID